MTQPDQLERQVRHMAADAAVRRIAPGEHADPDKLLDSVSFHRAVSTLDPSAPGYDQDVRAAMRSALASDSRFGSGTGAAPAPAVLGPSAGAGAGQAPLTLEDAEGLSGAEFSELAAAGKLAHLGWGAARRRTGDPL